MSTKRNFLDKSAARRAIGFGLVLVLGVLANCGNVETKSTDAGSTADASTVGPVDAEVATDATLACVPSSSVCAQDVVRVCDATGMVASDTACLLGCFDAERCNKLDPSNGLAAHLDDAAQSLDDVVFVGSATIDTSAGSISDESGTIALSIAVDLSGPVEILVIRVKSLSAGDIDVVGTRALAIVSDGAIVIDGILDVSGVANVNGPGALLGDTACTGKNGSGSEGRWSAGAGGGFGSVGGGGGAAFGHPGGLVGTTSGTLDLVPLRGGCPGGHGGGNVANPNPGNNATDPGGGGGAIQLVSNLSISLGASGVIAANGGGAKGGTGGTIFCLLCPTPFLPFYFSLSCFSILLEAPTVSVASEATLVAGGGGGSCYTNRGRDGRIDGNPAVSGNCSSLATYGSGGAGAAQTTAAEAGGGGTGTSTPHGGGGGGGVGRIRVNLPLGASFSPQGLIAPAATAGVLGLR